MGNVCAEQNKWAGNKWTDAVSYKDHSSDSQIENFDDKSMGDMFDNVSMNCSPTFISKNSATNYNLEEPSFEELSSISSLSRVAKFEMTGRLVCMSWNIHHDFQNTPFDFYWTSWAGDLLGKDREMLFQMLDVADVFFNMDPSSELARTTPINKLVPPFLLSTAALDKFCTWAKCSPDQRENIMNLSTASISDFLRFVSGKSRTDDPLYKIDLVSTHNRRRGRSSSPLQLVYDPIAFQILLEEDVLLLPALILDSLHVLIIRFAVFLKMRDLSKAFSDCEPVEQIALFSKFNEGELVGNMSIPRKFKEMKLRLYKLWNKMFEDKNVVQQIWSRANAADIILLQKVNKEIYDVLTRQFSRVYNIVPNIFPTDQSETAVICLLKSTVDLQETKKIRRIDNRHFAVSCKSWGILYNVGVVCLDKSESSHVKKKVLAKLMPSIGNNPVIFGGDFGEDLSASHNAVPRAVLHKYNGINYEDKASIMSVMRQTRTYLNFELGKSYNPITEGIFTSLPLVQNSLCDFNEWENNPCDQAPIFQDIMLGSF